MHTIKKVVAALAALPLGIAGLVALPSSSIAGAPQIPGDGLVAQYSFENKPGDNKTVANTASGSSFGAAEVQNPSSALWGDKALTLSGGPHSGNGSWVKLPADLLKNKQSGSIQMEVKADPAMLHTFHFMWNIGNGSNGAYVFSAINCASGREPLAGIKASGVETLVQSKSCTVQGDAWTSITATFDGDAKIAKLYVNGAEVASGSIPSTPADVTDQSLNTIAYSPWGDDDFKGKVSTFRVYDKALKPADAEAINEVDAGLHGDEIAGSVIDGLGFTNQTVTGNYLALPNAGGKVTWTSSDPSVITDRGVVNQPPQGSADKTVTLTAKSTVRGVTRTHAYTITVKPSTKTVDQILEERARGYVVPTMLASGTKLPDAASGTTLSLSGENGISVSNDRVVSISGNEAKNGVVVARLSVTGATAPVTKRFNVKVLPSSKSQTLLAYDRNATSADQANNGDIAHSMHLALMADGASAYTPLNENYGIFFPLGYRSQPVNMNTQDYSRSLKDPSVFYMADGSFGVLSVRTNRGTDVADARNSVLFAKSKDLLSYDEQEESGSIIDVGETNGVNRPYGVYDSASQKYLVGWLDDSGIAKYTTFDSLNDSASHHGDVLVGDFARIGEVSAPPEVRQPQRRAWTISVPVPPSPSTRRGSRH